MFPFLQRFWTVCLHWLRVFFALLFPSRCRSIFGRRKTCINKKIRRLPPKPAWVVKEIIRLKAFMPDNGCRKIADTFNRMYAQSRRMTVSKTFANDVIRGHNYEIQVIRRTMKNRIPGPVQANLVWGMDLTGKTDGQGNLHNMIGIVEHQSRACLGLTVLKDKTAIAILRLLLDAVEYYGKPRFLRTDNEPVFTSWLFRTSLWLIGIRHQLIDKCCPWQNGRIERFWRTLKERLDQWQANGMEELNGALTRFRFWYNHVRPHQHLCGRTPAEVWKGQDVFTEGYKREYWFEAWDGLLTGVYLE